MPRKRIKKTLKKWKKYSEISNIGPITRRYFVMNAFDGALTMLGVVIGAYFSGVLKPITIISAGIAGSIAMGSSGMTGAYMTEKAERTKKIKDIENAMLTGMKDGIHRKSHRFASIYAAIVDGVTPALAAMLVISPFFIVNFGVISSEIAFWLSIVITLIVLLLLGFYLAIISDENMLKYGIQMLIVGLITAFLCVGVAIVIGGNSSI
jgi:predicted membrane protein (TIGR00267 family)